VHGLGLERRQLAGVEHGCEHPSTVKTAPRRGEWTAIVQVGAMRQVGMRDEKLARQSLYKARRLRGRKLGGPFQYSTVRR